MMIENEQWLMKLPKKDWPLAQHFVRNANYEENPVCLWLDTEHKFRVLDLVKEFSLAALSRVAVAFQMIVFDHNQGPEEDGSLIMIRRHWYAWYKTRFAMPLAAFLGEDFDDINWGNRWAGRLSQTYAWFVDNTDTIYRNLWVEDNSRMMQNWNVYDELFKNANIVLAVEKDSAFKDFSPLAEAIGARVIVSGKGKMGKAATERMLWEVFGWRDWQDPFSFENPLIVLHISDHDYDGEAVIGPTFAEQARRYTPFIREARVGITPEMIEEQVEKTGTEIEKFWYPIKQSNKAYKDWANKEAMWEYGCSVCGKAHVYQGEFAHHCPICGNSIFIADRHGIPYGFEMEALPKRILFEKAARILIEMLGEDYLVDQLRQSCEPTIWRSAEDVVAHWLEDHEEYQRVKAILEGIEPLRNAVQNYLYSLQAIVEKQGEKRKNDYYNLGDHPDMEDFVTHAREARMGSWSPFSVRQRTEALTQDLIYYLEDFKDELDEVEYDFPM